MSQANDLVIDATLVKSLISTQFPQWADLLVLAEISRRTINEVLADYRNGLL